MHDVENSLTALSTGRRFAPDSGARGSLTRRWRRRPTSRGSLRAAVARAKARERPSGVLAHERLLVIERPFQDRDIVPRTDIAEHHGGVALQAAKLGALHRRALEGMRELLLHHA